MTILRPASPSAVPFADKVAEYLACCAKHAALLSPKKYHPSEIGALKLIYHHGELQATQIREAYQAATGTAPEATEGPAPAARPRRVK